MRKTLSFIAILTLIFLSFCGSYDFKQEGLYAVMKTSNGEMVFMLYYDKTPITVGNFVGLAEGTKEFVNPKTGRREKRPYYAGLIFHRIIEGFMIQGGCPLGDGRGDPGYSFVDEFSEELRHDAPGVLSMANAGPGTNGSQFFITLAATPHLDGRHTVFGRLVHGEDVIKKISSVKTGSMDRPIDPVTIESIRIVRVGPKAKAFDAEAAFARNAELLKKIQEEQDQRLKALLTRLKVNTKKISTTKTGLRYYVRKRGGGAKPERGQSITAHYTLYLADGTKVDSSLDRGQPLVTPIGVGRVIPGWDEAFLDMNAGEKRVLIVPFNLAYGERGRPPVIPPRATLIFEVELISVK